MKYDYKCLNKKCRKNFILDVISTTKIEGRRHVGAVCPLCHSRNVVKLLSAPPIHFKGAGWGKDKKDK